MYTSLQSCRAIAALLVVFFHLGGAISAEKYFGISEFSVLFSFGSSGVEFFFVLSGFIILSAHRKDISQPRNIIGYIKKRLIRIVPSYWIIFLAVYFAAIMSPALRDTVPHDLFTIIKSLALFPQDNIYQNGSAAPVLVVAWTLQYEMAFYLLFSLAIINRWLGITISTAIICFFIYNYPSKDLPFPMSFITQDYILLFVFGMATSILCASKKTLSCNYFYYLTIGFILFSVISFDIIANLNLFEGQRTLIYGISSAFIIFGLVKAEDRGVIILKWEWLQTIGNSSYALYLIHFPLISLMCKIAISLHMNTMGVTGAIISYTAIATTCIISSVIFHKYIEKPIAIAFKNKISAR